MDEPLVPRRDAATVQSSLDAFRVVLLHGPRQAGKTTLLRAIAAQRGMAFASLDRREDRQLVKSDPSLFLSQLGVPAAIDEVQRGGDDLVLAIKDLVDDSRTRGQFFLTGSTNFLTVPSLSESLAGRVDVVTLLPLSVGERLRGQDSLVTRAFEEGVETLARHDVEAPARQTYFDLCVAGGFPEAQALPVPARRRWFSNYVETVIDREVRTSGDIRRRDALVRMVRLIAATTGGELNVTSMGSALGIDRATADSYLAWLETTFLAKRIPPWTRNPKGRVVRRPKLFMLDSGVAASLVGRSASALSRLGEPMAGPLLETFVGGELAKQLGWLDMSAELFHFRQNEGPEIDFVIEADDGRVIAIEVKATSPRSEDAKWLKMLRERLDDFGTDFVAGLVLHTGTRRIPLGDRLIALPISDLWS